MAPTDLPVEAAVPELRAALRNGGRAVLVAPPGSGKTTVVPLRLLDDVDGKILLLEPRRLATRAAARRMAQLVGEPVGLTVGYVTRHDRATSAATRIEVVTEGVLTRRLQNDPGLPGVSVVIFDELHERNLQTDLGLALTLDVRSALRPDLSILAMSATIDAARVADLLGEAAVISAGAAAHPVDLRWRPAPPKTRRLEEHVAAVVRSALAEEEGDLLVFLPGMAEIRRVHERLSGALAEVRLLHGSLPAEEQDAAIAPSTPPFRKVVLSTDIAESSLTVEGISVVIDSGLARAPRFDPRTGMTRLQTISISRSSADQRTGRAGRLGPGVAYRLWSKMEHAARRPHIDPEITQVDLAGLALELAAWGTPDPGRLRWLDPPPEAAWSEAISLLETLGAIADGHITASGRRMAALPLHPRLARMVVDGAPDQWLAVVLATLVDERDMIRGRPEDAPVDIALRANLIVDPELRHPAAPDGAARRLRAASGDLARRAGVSPGDQVDLHATGRVLALAFPDRLAIRRGSPGRFQLRTGNTAFMPAPDVLATEEFVVVADLDGKRRDARIRLAAGIDRADVSASFAHEVDTSKGLVWEGRRLVERSEQRLGGIALETVDRRPTPSERTTAAIIKRIRDDGLEVLPWTDGARALRRRVAYLRATMGEDWPDWSDAALRRHLDAWLAPYLAGATGWDDVERLDLASLLRATLHHSQVSRLGALAPTHIAVASGRRVAIDYSRERPTVSVRVQEMFGTNATPSVGGEPVVLELLSPARRPLQITSDLAGFWTGTWAEVRKEMAGRYPKHDWPADPARARPSR